MSSMMSTNRVLPGSSVCANAAPARVELSSARARACRRPLMFEGRIRHPMIRCWWALHEAAGAVAVHVACAAAVTQLVGAVQLAFERPRMAPRLEILRVAAGTAAGIGRRAEGHLLAIVAVAAHAGQRHAVIARIGARLMTVGHEIPVRIAVTGGAVTRRRHVSRGHAGGRDMVVTARTARRERAVIDL